MNKSQIYHLLFLSVFLGPLSHKSQATTFSEQSSPPRVVSGEFILTFASFEQRARALVTLASSDHVEEIYEYRLIPSLSLKLEQGLSNKLQLEIFQALETRPTIEPNQIVSIAMPNDPKFLQQYGLRNTGQQSGVVGADIDALAAWQTTTGSKDVLVAVLDTGIDYLHPDLIGNYSGNLGEQGVDEAGHDKRFNGIDDDNNGFVDDYLGWNFVSNTPDPMDDNGFSHGTHCAGVIGAVSDNAIGVTGVAWQVGLVAVKFLDAAGTGNLANAIKAIEYATEIGAHITNNSWGGALPSYALHQAIAAANDANSLFIAAAGNQGLNTDFSPHYPSSVDLPNVVSVAATDRHDQLASFSNYGVASVHIAAPGVDILSTLRGESYGELSGTSMAAPFVSGAAALLMAHFSDADHLEIRRRILNSADRLAQLSSRTQHGSRLNLGWALRDDLEPPRPVTEVLVVDQGRDEVTLRWRLASEPHVIRYEIRVSKTSIENERDWTNAKIPTVSDYQEGDETAQAVIEGLGFNFDGYLALRAVDRTSNISDIGPSFTIATLPVAIDYQNSGQSLDGLVVEGAWGLEYREELGKTVFTTNPNQNYEPNANYLLTFPQIDTSQRINPELVVHHSWQIERGYDFGYIEVSYGGGKWLAIRRVTDSRPFVKEVWPIEQHEQTQVRLRFNSDASVEEKGWFINELLFISDLF